MTFQRLLSSLFWRLTTPVVCSWCNRTLRRALLPLRASHTICPACKTTMLATLPR